MGEVAYTPTQVLAELNIYESSVHISWDVSNPECRMVLLKTRSISSLRKSLTPMKVERSWAIECIGSKVDRNYLSKLGSSN